MSHRFGVDIGLSATAFRAVQAAPDVGRASSSERGMRMSEVAEVAFDGLVPRDCPPRTTRTMARTAVQRKRPGDADDDVDVERVTVTVWRDALWAPLSTDPMTLLSTRTPPGGGERRTGQARRDAGPWMGAGRRPGRGKP